MIRSKLIHREELGIVTAFFITGNSLFQKYRKSIFKLLRLKFASHRLTN